MQAMMIQLTQGQVTKVDRDLYLFLNQFKWTASYDPRIKGYRATRSSKDRKTEYIHHYIVGKPPKGMVVDHINGDTLDNRRKNLRIVTVRGNNQNRLVHRQGHLPGTEYHHKGKRPWKARYALLGKTIYIGYFATQEEAHKAYIKALKKVENL